MRMIDGKREACFISGLPCVGLMAPGSFPYSVVSQCSYTGTATCRPGVFQQIALFAQVLTQHTEEHIKGQLTGPLDPVFASPRDIWNSTRLRSSAKASFMEKRITSITSCASRSVASSRSSQRARACGEREGGRECVMSLATFYVILM